MLPLPAGGGAGVNGHSPRLTPLSHAKRQLSSVQATRDVVSWQRSGLHAPWKKVRFSTVLSERPETAAPWSDVHARYDPETDTLFLESGGPQRTTSAPAPHLPGVYGDYALDTNELVGLTVLSFYETFAVEHPGLAPIPVS